MPRALIAGLPADAASWLERRLKPIAGLSFETTTNGEATLGALGQGDWSLLVMDHNLQNPPAAEILSQARNLLGLKKMQVIYCLERSQLARLPERLSKDLRPEDQVLFHPLDHEKLAREVASALHVRLPSEVEPEAASNGEISDAAAGLWEQFKDQIFGQVAVLEKVTVALLDGTLGKGLRQQAQREAHKLAGSLGSLGLAEGTRLARGMEHLLEPGLSLGQAESLRLCDEVVALRNLLERGPAGSTGTSSSKPQQARQDEEDGRPLLLVIDGNPEEASQLVMEASSVALRAEWAADLAAARDRITRQRPSVVLLDPSLGGGFDLLAELSRHHPPIPALVLTSHGSFEERLEVMRLGAQGFLEKPMPAAQVLDAVRQVADRAKASAAKVLAVDDDPLILESLRRLLEMRGIKLTALSDPLRFWEALEGSSPDLLLLDVDMPHLSGIELCRVLRNDARWGGTPVLFLTAHADTETVQQVFAAGGDDYVLKPIVGPELVARIATRLDRTHQLLTMGESDGPSGLGVPRRSMRALDQLLRLGRRHKEPLCLVVLDLDEIDRINDVHGYVAGDQAHRRVARLLVGAFRSEDVVSRWEGDEFVAGLYSMARADGVQRVAELLESLRQEEFTGAAGAQFRVTFSAGVAEYPKDGSDLQSLYRAAASALHQAKAAGGDRVLPAGWRSRQGEASPGPDVVLVDDDEALGGLLLHALETRGYRAEWLKDGRTAVEKLDAGSASLRPRVLLLDVDLPSLDGLSVLRRLSENGVAARTRIIMLTARSSESEVVSALEWGAFDHVAKPFSLPVLMQRVRRALEA